MKLWVFALLGPVLSAQVSSIDLGAMDESVNPCVDFYQYACGTWMKKNPIPPDQATWGRFNELGQRNQEILRNILEKAEVDNGKRTAVEQKIGDFYSACMDEKGVEEKGLAPLKPELDRIESISDKQSLADEVARLQARGVPAFFGFGSGQDAKNSKEMIAQAGQGGISLPDRDFYLKNDPKSEEIRHKYVVHIQKMFELLGSTPESAAKAAQTILEMETAFAQGSLDRVSLRDPNKRYHRMPVEQLSTLAPSFDWPEYLRDMNVSVKELNIGMPEFFKSLEAVLKDNSLDKVKTYLTWHLLHYSAPLLPQAFVQENFNFFAQTLTGAKELQPRWKRCVTLTDHDLGEALGQRFVETTFGQQGKTDTLAMVNEIEAEMAKDVQSLTWMSPATKQQAIVKLHGVANKIGYPEHYRDYSAVKVVKDDLVGNNERASAFELHRRLAEIGRPVDPLEWGMTPPTVNAYYSPPMNNINFPAGILQPPFYFKTGDKAANYGAIGAVVGHELTHGFDDSGRQYDATGNLRDWWTADDAKAFQQRVDCVVNEYGNFVADGDVKLNGKLTLGENTADNGGVRLAYMALMDSLAKHTLPDSKLDGFTPEQRFFIAFGQVWCQNQTPQAARLQAQTNPHSLGRYRTNGVVQNSLEFQKAFACKAGQPMVSENACRVW